jgi:hypothetical protein
MTCVVPWLTAVALTLAPLAPVPALARAMPAGSEPARTREPAAKTP